MKLKSLSILCLFVLSCQNLKQFEESRETGYSVNPPFKSVAVKAMVFQISTLVVNELVTHRGSKITIPANTIITKDGKSITDSVTVAFKEFHTPGEIIVSGIPMLYKEGDSVCGFESAGMFEMQATLDNDTLEIAKGKNIHVDLASYKSDKDFNTYLFENGRWNELTKNNIPKENVVKEALIDEIAKAELSINDHSNDNSFFSLNVNDQTYPEFKPFKAMVWQYKGNDPASDPKKNRDFFSKPIQNAEIRAIEGEENLYEITLKKSSKTLKFAASPAESYGNIKSKEDQSKEIKTEVGKKKNLLKRMADFSRSLKISKFGIYNCDRIYGNRNTKSVNANLNLPKGASTEINALYLLCPAQSIAIGYYPGSRITFDATQANYLVAIMKNSDVMIAKPGNFDKPVSQDGKINFQFEPTRTPVESLDDLSQIISSL